MGEIVNLRRVKKAKTRARAAQDAAANRARTGITKAERDALAQRERVAAAKLDGARLTPGADQPGTA